MPMSGTPLGEVDTRLKRRSYLSVLILVAVLATVLMAIDDLSDPYLLATYPTLVGLNLALAIGVATRRIPLRAVEWVLFAGPVAALLGRWLLWVFGTPPGANDDAAVLATMIWVGLLFPLSFLAFGTRRGVQLCLGIYLAFAVAIAPLVLWPAADTISDDVLAMSAIGFASLYLGVIALLWVLASRLEQLVASQARAEILQTQASTDVLTGVANRRTLDDAMDRAIAGARRSGRPVSVIVIDLDRFKQVNDVHGHEVGDRVLVAVVDHLSATVREADLLGRWGGEEFVLLAPDTLHADAVALAERCRAALHGVSTDPVGVVTASFGVATLAADDDARSLMRRADLALYAAKREGRDRVVGIPDLEAARPDEGDVDADSTVELNGAAP
jgi:diguanylate cyclase (GGDEF)-like protein